MKNVYIETLGCSKNQVDSEKMAFILSESSYNLVDDPFEAHIIIVNTCGFIESAKTEAVDTVFEMITYKTEGVCEKVVLAGCFAERYTQEVADEFSEDEVDLIFGVGDISKIVEALDNSQRIVKPEGRKDLILERKLIGFPGTTYLRISDGCSNNCTYCAIPLIRGALNSRKMNDIIVELKNILEKNVIQEIIIISQDTTNYGVDSDEGKNLADLLKSVDALLSDSQWLRVLYMHPDHITETFLDKLLELKSFVPYFDIPFQSASEEILKLMGRKGSSEIYLRLIDSIRNRFSDAVIRSTFICGFPGETEKHFTETIDFIKKANIDWVGAFEYSDEDDTLAASFIGKVTQKVKKTRYNFLMNCAEEVSNQSLTRFIGKTVDILVEESVDENLFIGRFWGQAPDVDGLIVLDAFDAAPGKLVKAQIKKRTGNDFFASGL